MATEQKVKLTVYLTAETDKAMRHYAVDNGMDISETVEKAVLALTGAK